jgi:D-sedoheptulose 7-phosphate isomerase
MKEFMSYLIGEIEENACVTTDLAHSCSVPILEAAKAILSCLRAGGKLIVFGNGGSAAEAEHFVTELIGRYRADRQPLAAVSLTSDATSLTAIGNDYGFECIFSRQLQAISRPNDVVLAISTSGNSPNILRAVEAARTAGLLTIGLTGITGGELRGLVRICIGVPSNSTPRIQEAHSLIVHILCGIVEDAFVRDRHPAGGSESAIEEVR